MKDKTSGDCIICDGHGCALCDKVETFADNPFSIHVALVDDVKEAIVLRALKDTIGSLNSIKAEGVDSEDDEEVIDACRVLIEYFGYPDRDFLRPSSLTDKYPLNKYTV